MDLQTLFSKLKTAYSQSGLSDNELLGIAAGLFDTGLVTDENVDKIVETQGSAMKGYQSAFDSRYSAKKNALTEQLTEQLTKSITAQNEKAFKEKYHIGDDGKQVVKQEPATEDEKLLARLSALMDKQVGEKLKPYLDKLTADEEAREKAERTSALLASAKKAGVDENLAKAIVSGVPTDATDLDSFWKDKAQMVANIGFSHSPSPGGGSPSLGADDGKAIAAQIKAGGAKEK